MKARIIKIIILSMIALAATGITLAAVSAHPDTLAPTATPVQDCASCHPDHYSGWQQGAHSDVAAGHMKAEEMNCIACHKDGQIGAVNTPTDPNQPTQNTMQQFGPPLCLTCHATGYDPSTGKAKSDGITCEVCHGEMLPDHPARKMPVDETNALCHNCHTDSRFNWSSWTSSAHYQANMKCSTCHDPHTTSLKISNGAGADPSELCMSCHKGYEQESQHSIHAKTGVTCVDCHLGPSKGKDDFHRVPDHSFKPSIETCSNCHANQMHGVGEAIMPTEIVTAVPLATETVTPAPVVTQTPAATSKAPAPANVLGFIGMAGMIGLVGGIVFRKSFKKG
jgi:predicted CXXCH cytochrome family protein